MSRSFRMQGGSAGSAAVADAGSFTGFFQPGVNSTMLSGKKNIKGRILPARDSSLSPADSAYLTSVIPYRDMSSGELDKETLSPAFTPWFAIIRAYRFFGRSEESFISPLTLKPFVQSAIDCADPVLDCYEYAKKCDRPEWVALTEKPADTSQERKSVLMRPGAMAILNMYASEDGKPFDNVIAVMTKTAMDNFKDKLSNPSVYGEDPADPDFPRFLFGDITNPDIGLVVQSAQIASADNKQIKFNGFVIGTKDKELCGVHRMPLPNPEAILAKRWDLGSSDTIKVLSYQELVDLLVNDGAIPLELIKLACGDMANIGSGPSKNVTVSSPERTAAQEPRSLAPQGAITQVAPPTPPAPPAPPTPPAPPAPPAPVYYWVSTATGVQRVDSETARGIVAASGDVQMMSDDQSSGWKPATHFGFDAIPGITSSSGVPQQPAAASVPSAPVVTAAPEKVASATPPANGATAEEIAEHAALMARLDSTTEPLTTAEASRLVQLSRKMQGKE